MSRLRGAEAAAATAAATAAPAAMARRRWHGLRSRIRSMLQEQESKVLAAIRTCQEVEAQLGQYQITLAGWCEQQQRLEDGLQRVIGQSRSARELVRQEETRAAAKKEEVKEGGQQLHAALETLRRVAAAHEVAPAIDDADHCTDEAEQRAGECMGMFPDVVAAAAARKVSVEAPLRPVFAGL